MQSQKIFAENNQCVIINNHIVTFSTGLDPYSPIWNLNSNRLAASDAIFVEAIHTSGNTGNRLFADVDYFVNGGDDQPGCWTSLCSHNRSWEVFAATVTFNHLHGNQCTNVAEMRNNQCRGSQLPLGNSDVNKRGCVFKLLTTPYLLLTKHQNKLNFASLSGLIFLVLNLTAFQL